MSMTKCTLSPKEFQEARKRLRLTQAELAHELGVSRNTVTRWEMGLHRIPSMAVILLAKIIYRPAP